MLLRVHYHNVPERRVRTKVRLVWFNWVNIGHRIDTVYKLHRSETLKRHCCRLFVDRTMRPIPILDPLVARHLDEFHRYAGFLPVSFAWHMINSRTVRRTREFVENEPRTRWSFFQIHARVTWRNFLMASTLNQKVYSNALPIRICCLKRFAFHVNVKCEMDLSTANGSSNNAMIRFSFLFPNCSG